MGLKTTNYKVQELGITIPKAYARLTNIDINVDGEAFGTFEIHQTREDLTKNKPLERFYISDIINKDLPVHNQLYIKAKQDVFIDWEDDIISEVE